MPTQVPGVSDVHIDRALTNVSVAWFIDSRDYIADKVFPPVPVDKRSDVFWKYTKSDWRRTNAQKRAPGTESAGVGWSKTTDNYFAEVYAVHVDIDDQTRANADNDWTLDSDATKRVTGDLLLQKDQLWAATYMQTGVWARDLAGVSGTASTADEFTQWDQAGSSPLQDVTDWKAQFRLLNAKPVSFIVLGPNVWTTLQNHPEILDRIKYTQRGIITEDLVAEFFGIPKLFVAWASQATGADNPDSITQDEQATYEWIADPNALLFGYAPNAASLLEPSAGYTFNWRGYGAGNRFGLTTSQFRAPLIRADRIEGEAAYVHKLVSKDCGVYASDVVAPLA
jgi:hypothetical protein